jgi:chromosome segregation ATPase
MQLLLEREADLLAAAEIGEGLLRKNQVLNEKIHGMEKNEEDLRRKLADVEIELEGFRASEDRIRGQSKITKEAVEDMGDVIRNQGEKLEDLELQLSAIQLALHDTERERDEANARCRALQTELEAHAEQKMADETEHTVALESLQTRLKGMETTGSELRMQLEIAEKDLVKASESEQRLHAESAARDGAVSDMEGVIRAQNEHIQDLEAHLAATQRALQEAVREREESTNMFRTVQNQLDAANSEIETCKKQQIDAGEASRAELESLKAMHMQSEESVKDLRSKLSERESEIKAIRASALEDANELQQHLHALQCKLEEV